MELTPGEIWWARPDPGVGREQAGRRPVLVVSSPVHLRVADTLVYVVPLTTRDRGWPNHVAVDLGASAPVSFAMTEQCRCISRERLIERIGILRGDRLIEVREWIVDFLV